MILLKKPLIIFMFAAALAVYLLQWRQVPLPSLINNYLNNLLCMPVVLTVCLALLQLIKKNYTLTIPIFVIASVTFYYSVYFEWYLPKVNTRYTADVIDVFLYILGAVIFYYLQKYWVHKKE
tara:strand:- start:177674 stop:178039 length:366 start_codon:yes stop_codon:yes gene_type:complete